jgi:hypothetical protein
VHDARVLDYVSNLFMYSIDLFYAVRQREMRFASASRLLPGRWTTVRAAAFLCCVAWATAKNDPDSWQLNGFVRPPNAQPVIVPKINSVFVDHPGSTPVHWEALHTFNPAAVVRHGNIYVLYRAEDNSGENKIATAFISSAIPSRCCMQQRMIKRNAKRRVDARIPVSLRQKMART